MCASQRTSTRSLPTSIAAAVADARWLAHRYDPQHDAFHLLSVPREIHRRATFLTDEHLPAGGQPLVVGRADAMAAAPPAAPIHFIFHSAYCCSTLLARAFDRPGWAMGLKEPVVLNDIVGWRRRAAAGANVATVLNDALTLLARPFDAGEAVVVKPSNIVNGLAATMLSLRTEARALLLHAPLRTYLASIASKGLEGRLWVRTLLLGLIDDRQVDLGFSTRDHLGHTDLQIAAVGWLAQQALFEALVTAYGPSRLRRLDSETLVADPAGTMSAIASLFGLPLNANALAKIVAGPAFQRHSKIDTAFTAGDRVLEHRAASATHADEIEKVARWAEVVAKTRGIAITPSAPLLPARAR